VPQRLRAPIAAARETPAGRTRFGGDEEHSARQRVRRVGDEHSNKILAEDVGLHANAPCASEIGEYDRVIRRLVDAEHARARLFHILVAGDLGEHGHFEFAHDPLRRNCPREGPCEEAGERDQQDFEDGSDCRSRGEAVRDQRGEG